jgi:dephospho-CoA kinase
MINNPENPSKIIVAFVGMPGAGKSEATQYLNKKNVPFIRFGDLTEEEIKNAGLELNTENEKIFREKIRKDFGMAAYAIKAKPKNDELLKNNNFIVIDGLYSWEEYKYLKEQFSFLQLIVIYSRPDIRYERLARRPIRPVVINDSRDRDIREIEMLNKGGPIAIADYCILNNDEGLDPLYNQIEEILEKLNIKL